MSGSFSGANRANQRGCLGCVLSPVLGSLYFLAAIIDFAANGEPFIALVLGIVFGVAGLVTGIMISVAFEAIKEKSGRASCPLVPIIVSSLIAGALILLNLKSATDPHDTAASFYGWPLSAISVDYADENNIRHPLTITFCLVAVDAGAAVLTLMGVYFGAKLLVCRITGTRVSPRSPNPSE